MSHFILALVALAVFTTPAIAVAQSMTSTTETKCSLGTNGGYRCTTERETPDAFTTTTCTFDVGRTKCVTNKTGPRYHISGGRTVTSTDGTAAGAR